MNDVCQSVSVQITASPKKLGQTTKKSRPPLPFGDSVSVCFTVCNCRCQNWVFFSYFSVFRVQENPVSPVTIPSGVRHLDAIAGMDFHAVLEPFPRHLFIGHLTLEHGLFGGLDRQVRDALQHLQLFVCGNDTSEGQ